LSNTYRMPSAEPLEKPLTWGGRSCNPAATLPVRADPVRASGTTTADAVAISLLAPLLRVVPSAPRG
jgi:hypothetical protein